MRKTFWALFAIFCWIGLESCETKCSEERCSGTAVNFNFRYVDSEGNDLIFGPDSLRIFDADSVVMIGQNEGAISFFPITVNGIMTSDTSGILQGSLTSKHNRYIIMAMDSALFIADSLQPDSILIDSIYVKRLVSSSDTLIAGFITYETECCTNIIDRFDLTIDSTTLCTQCNDSQVHLLVKDRDSL